MPTISTTRNAYFWAILERLGPQIVTFALSVLIARMVDPAAYGLLGMLGIFMALAAAFSELALSAALVQRKHITPDDETSVFYINIAAGIVLTFLLCAISPFVATFFRQPILTPLLCLQSLTVLISSFGIVQMALITRNMQFRTNAMIETASSVSSGVVGVYMAWNGQGIWSLVGMNLTRAAASVAMLWIVRDWRPRGHFSMTCVKSMWSYSSRLLYASLIHRVITNLQSVFLGRFYPPASLGLYTRALGFQALPAGILVGIVQRVAFPLFSRHQDDRPALLAMLRRQVRVLSLGVSAIMATLFVASDQLIPLLLGPRWNDAIPLLKILCFGGVLASIFPLHCCILQALGDSKLFFRVDILKKLVILAVTVSVVQFGVAAMAWGVVAISITDYFISAWPNVRRIEYAWSMQAWDVLPAALLGFVPAILISLLPWHERLAPLPVLCAKISIMCLTGVIAIAVLRNTYFQDTWRLITTLLSRLRLTQSERNESGLPAAVHGLTTAPSISASVKPTANRRTTPKPFIE